MTTLALELDFRTAARPRLFGDGGGEAMLADAIAGAWEDLAAARAVGCPVCRGELAPHVTTLAGELIAARCTDCGTELD
jgi:hypothetical protein